MRENIQEIKMPIPSQVPRAVATVRLGKVEDRANLTERKEGERQGKKGKPIGAGLFFGGG
ncbi:MULTISPECIES: hypothetical protein [unclassified Bartonella]|uniref:hypothetical protein n=1 Tax=unclassified Bartonella TaxID=2645622 RepID=UPI0035D08178